MQNVQPLQYVAMGSNTELARYLLSQGADRSAQTVVSGSQTMIPEILLGVSCLVFFFPSSTAAEKCHEQAFIFCLWCNGAS